MIDYLKNKYTAYKNRGFTLIELIVVMAIIAVLVLLAAPRFIGQTEKARNTQIQNDIRAVETKVDEYLIEHGDLEGWGEPVVLSGVNLYNKKGPVNDGNPVQPGSYQFVSDEILKEVKSKLDGTFYANDNGTVYYESGVVRQGDADKKEPGTPEKPDSEKEPVYSDEEIEGLIAEGYIPIATADELNNVRNPDLETYGKGTKWEKEYEGGLDKQYIQVLNLNLSGYSEKEEGWNPIGTDKESSFTGTYDGGNYVITGLEVKGEGENYQGLFGYTYGAIIRNVGLIDNKVTGKDYVGGLVGYARERTEISNSYATGLVTGTGTGENDGSYAGGLVGYADGRAYDSNKITNSYATGEVIGNIYAGGLVGSAYESIIENSYATGSVTGTTDYIGGLVGYVKYSNVESSYAEGSVEGTGDYVGGLAGWAGESTIKNSYAIGSVEGAENYAGGLVGMARESKIINSYATGEVAGSYDVGGLAGSAWYNTDIINSYATGSVKGTGTEGKVGGLAGSASSDTTISNSYAKGKVTGNRNVGGLVGYITGFNTKISNSYATGEVTGTTDYIGGLVGYIGGFYNEINNSYWDKDTTKQTTSAGQDESFGKTTDDMKKQTTYSGWDFETIWKIDEGEYPTLR